jgi:small GTP-binding protein
VFDNFSAIEEVGGETINVILWDLAGQDEYSAVRSTCYQQVAYDVVLLCFSVVHRDSFDNVRFKWLPELKRISSTTPIILVGTKTDMRAEDNAAHVPAKEGEKRAKEIKARRYLECTAKSPDTVGKLITESIQIVLEQDKLRKATVEKQYKKEKKMEDKIAAALEKERKKKEKAALKAGQEPTTTTTAPPAPAPAATTTTPMTSTTTTATTTTTTTTGTL